MISARSLQISAQALWAGTICAAPAAPCSKLTSPQPSPIDVLMPTSQALYSKFSSASAAGERVQGEPLCEVEPLHNRSDLLPLRLAHDRVMQAQADIGGLIGGKPGKSFDRQIDALSFVGATGVEHDERVFRILKPRKHFPF